MIQRMWWGMAQKCRRCEAKGYTGEDCWWPADRGFFGYAVADENRVTKIKSICLACEYERIEAWKSAKRAA